VAGLLTEPLRPTARSPLPTTARPKVSENLDPRQWPGLRAATGKVVETLALEEDDGVVAAQGADHEILGEPRGGEEDDLEPGDVGTAG
jgi:hypothetical protein